jgi:hypothetical protein
VKHRDPFASWFTEKQKLLADDKDLPRLPVIEISDADPPAFLKDSRLVDLHRVDDSVGKLDDRIDVESWLGCYNTDENRITIWRRGVELASRWIRCEYKDLLDLVFAHELGHWFHDKAETPNGETWNPSALENATKEYLEAWAQWFAWLYAKEHGGLLCKVFEDLEKTQSKPYKVWREAFGVGEFSAEDQRKYLHSLAYLRCERSSLRLDHIKFEGLDIPEDVKGLWRGIVPNL